MLQKKTLYEERLLYMVNLHPMDYVTMVKELKNRFPPLDLHKLKALYLEKHADVKQLLDERLQTGGTRLRKRNKMSKLRKSKNTSRKRKTNKKIVWRR